jgi:hypothetical protein
MAAKDTTGIAGVVVAGIAHLPCCGLPIALQAGILGGAWAAWVEPWRPWLAAASIGLASIGVAAAHLALNRSGCAAGCSCRKGLRRRLAWSYGLLAATLLLIAAPMIFPAHSHLHVH